jgi:phosphate transport system protein
MMTTMNAHTYQPFDHDLKHIRARILEMGGMVERQLSLALEGLSLMSLEQLDDVIEGDKLINRQQEELNEACVQIIARHSPTAADLRMVMTVLMMITDLERIGDESKKIAKAIKHILLAENALVPRVELSQSVRTVIHMLRRALDGFARMDCSSTADIVRQDKEVDAAFKGIIRQLITYMMEDPRTISRGLDVLFIAKSIERIGDHAKNLSEYVFYMVNGRDVRHQKPDAIESALRQANP